MSKKNKEQLTILKSQYFLHSFNFSLFFQKILLRVLNDRMSDSENQFDEQIDEDELRIEFEEKCEAKRIWLTNELQIYGRYCDVSAKKLDDLDALTIAFFLHDNPQANLKLFHIGANNFTDRGLIDMVSSLQWHINLEELYVGNNKFTDAGIDALVEQISIFGKLRILSMGNCGVNDENFIQLCYNLSELPKLQQLLVPSNQIGDFGLISLSSLITSPALPSLRVLHIGDNPLTDYALNMFFQALQKNKTIKIIYLNDVQLDTITIKSVAEALRKNTTLEELNLANTGFSDQSASLIWKVLPYSSLKILHLWNNHITDLSIIELMDVMEDNILQLNYLGLTDNPFADQDLPREINDILKAQSEGHFSKKLVQEMQEKVSVKIIESKISEEDDSTINNHERQESFFHEKIIIEGESEENQQSTEYDEIEKC